MLETVLIVALENTSLTCRPNDLTMNQISSPSFRLTRPFPLYDSAMRAITKDKISFRNLATVVTLTLICLGFSPSRIAAVEEPVELNTETNDLERSFRNDVLPVLSKVGCNSGACHGALAGKGGFRLSLLGYDPAADYFTITRQARGRRIEPLDPGRSLLLAKPTGAIPHRGGVKFETDSIEYKIIAEWISQGVKAPQEYDAVIQELEISPGQATLQIGDEANLNVIASYSDGRRVDVTPWVKWTSADETVASVDEAGHVQVIGPGEGAITAWFSSRLAIARITSPFPNSIEPQDVPINNFIDKLNVEQLQKLQLPIAPTCTDEEFIRRAYLDSIGMLPSESEVRTFLESKEPNKRNLLIDSLLERPEFVDYWAHRWSDVLLINGTLLRPDAVKSYYTWIRGHVEQNTAWDDFVREILTAQGDTLENGATNFYALHQEPETMSENASQAFLGLSIACAKCHDHPLEKWTNDQYYGMASLFSRVRGKGWGGDSRNGDGRRTVFVVDSGELVQPRTGKPQQPTPLDGVPLEFDSTLDRRQHLANWMTSPENPYFARSITNRIWANYFGVGLVDQVDDMRISNPASNEELLTAAANYLIDQEFDLKELMKVIMQSAAYQRSSIPSSGNENDSRFYSRYFPRRLMAEVLLDGISQVTDVPTKFSEVQFLGADRQKTDFYPEGTRAIQLYDSAVRSYFLTAFGRNQREITCECERSNEPSMVQVLHIANGTTINEKLSKQGNQIDQLIEAGKSDMEILESLYLSALSRFPSPQEREKLSGILAAELATVDSAEEATKLRRVIWEDLYWSVLSSREFLFQH